MAVQISVVQVKPAKGRYDENLAECAEIFAQICADGGAPDVIVLPEAALTGYFLEGAVYDLARPAQRFADDLARAWQSTGSEREVDLCCGFYENDDGTYYNSAMYVRAGPRRREILHVHRKMFLPTYGVFDEARFLSRGRRLQTFETRYGRVAMLICEDMWHAIMPTIAAIKGARILLVPSAAPGRGIEGAHELTSITHWREILRAAASEHGVFVIYAGLTGFEGGKGMTGSSCVIDPRGEIIVQGPEFGECVLSAAIDLRDADLARASLPLLGDLEAVLPDLLLDDELPLPKGRA
ncbi:MAG TPA: nitrilase-related carbon-nitrogen hydrolase [Candidatus Baltobacteraceae bacterium]|nr:nitrilase-related carbon-nitrogen hydrolase [Candidatus Baltobacteraceae bacterium]